MKMTLFISPSGRRGIRLAHHVISNDSVTDAEIMEFISAQSGIDRTKLERGGAHQWPGKFVESGMSITTRHFE
jgi:hypothetical protein